MKVAWKQAMSAKGPRGTRIGEDLFTEQRSEVIFTKSSRGKLDARPSP